MFYHRERYVMSDMLCRSKNMNFVIHSYGFENLLLGFLSI
jgi:hypothetical protein